MKKIILFAAIFFSAVSVANAQTSTSNKGTATLTVNLQAVQSITVAGDVEIDYLTADDYAKGKEGEKKTELSVVAAGGFTVSVQATDDLKDANNSANVIAASSISVLASAKSNGDGFTPNANITLSKDAKRALFSSTIGGVDKKYNVSYTGKDANEYMKNYNAGEGNPQAYSTTITYTIAAQ